MNKKNLILISVVAVISFAIGSVVSSTAVSRFAHTQYTYVVPTYTNCWQERDKMFPDSHHIDGGELTHNQAVDDVNAYKEAHNYYVECMNSIFENKAIFTSEPIE